MPSEQDEAWADVGRSVLSYQFEQLGDELQVEFSKAARKAKNEDTIEAGDVRRLYKTLANARSMVDELAKIPEDFERARGLEEVLPPDQIQEILEQIEEGTSDE